MTTARRGIIDAPKEGLTRWFVANVPSGPGDRQPAAAGDVVSRGYSADQHGTRKDRADTDVEAAVVGNLWQVMVRDKGRRRGEVERECSGHSFANAH